MSIMFVRMVINNILSNYLNSNFTPFIFNIYTNYMYFFFNCVWYYH